MSYLVLARKFRPQTFEDVVAQKHITDTLQNAIRLKRFPHAFLFTGTRGTGKTTTARILAKALNCEKGPTPTPCNECVHCRQIANGSSLDVLEIDAASNTGVDNVRDLRESARYTPASARFKIYIIDEVHRLSKPAFDALLKTLEEPPAHVIFIFATTNPSELPATILSRCQRYDFRRIPFVELAAALRRIASEERIQIEDDALDLVALKGDGSLRDALSILEQVIAYSDRVITRQTIAETLGLADLELLFDLTDCILSREVARTLEIIQRLYAQGVDLSQFIEDFQEHFRKLLIVNAVANPSEYLHVSDQFRARYIGLKSRFTDQDIFRIIRMLADLRADLKAGADPALFFEVAMIRLVKLESSVLVEDVLKRLNELSHAPHHHADLDLFKPAQSGQGQPSGSSGGALPPSPGPPPRPPSGSQGLQDRQPAHGSQAQVAEAEVARPYTWKDFVESVKSDRPMLGECLGQAELTSFDDDVIELTYATNGMTHHQVISKRENQKLLEKHMESIFGRKLRLIPRIDRTRSAPTNNGAAQSSRFDLTPEELFQKRPELRQLTERLGGQIKSIKKLSGKGETDG